MQFRNVDVAALRAALDRARTALTSDDHALFTGAVDTVTALTAELRLQSVTLARLRRLFLGATSEKTSNVIDDDKKQSGTDGKGTPAAPAAGDVDGGTTAPSADDVEEVARGKTRGHGKNSADAYSGATRKKVTHETMHPGDKCAGCMRGKLYPVNEPAKLLRVHGMGPLLATVWECDRLRCNACSEVFTAPAPDGVGTEKYDESASAMVAMLRYGAGVPFNRIERLQDGLGVPLPASTQWDLVDRRAEALTPVFDALVQHAAQGEVLHNDDTSMTVLELGKRTREEALAAGESEITANRTGVRTSGVVAQVGEHKVALFFTGRQLAGEALEEVLQERMARLPLPIQMCDALPHNLPPALETIVANCLAHGRRYFVDIVESFPDETKKVLKTLADVYRNDAVAREQKMTAQERLLFHQQHSGPPMKELKDWMQAQLDEKRAEPNSPLGEALRYMLKHWSALTLFLRKAGAPLDNNICERALKKAILHRKNSLFYRTVRGALVGDMYMSLIHTAELNGVQPFPYLVELMRHVDDVARDPRAWLPWSYANAPHEDSS